ncbi:MAG: pitrilysin family protein [Balneolales bacterium]
MKQISLTMAAFIILCLSLTPHIHAQDLEEFEKNVTEFTLDNGLSFVILKRDVAPVISFVTYIDVGSANEPVGQTGIAHIFEHMAFKGSAEIGTTNYEEEIEAIGQMDLAYREWLREKNRSNPNEEKLEEKWEEFERIQERSQEYVVNNEFTQFIEREGASGLNAFTSADATAYFYSLPENKAELWFTLEADRFKQPVMREFYTEKDIIFEERRSRTDSSPIGRLIEEFVSIAYSAHPYMNPVIGWPSDIENTTIKDALEFYETYYVPSNITIGIAGDVDPDEMKRFAELYFGDMPAGDPAPQLMVEEPEQRGERRFVIEESSQPWFMMGFHGVEENHPDAKALDLLGSILAQGRTSRLYRRMVVEEQSALNAGAFSGFPGSKYQSLFLTYVLPNQGVDMGDVEATLLEEIEKVKEGDVRQSELDRVRTNARANLIRGLDSNSGLALSLAEAAGKHDDWRTVFTDMDELNDVTLEDIKRVANTYMVKKNRTVGMIQTEKDEEVTIN